MILTNTTRDELVICPSPIFHYFSQFTFYPWHILTYLRDNSFMTWCVTVSLLREVHWSDVETRRLSQKSCMYLSYSLSIYRFHPCYPSFWSWNNSKTKKKILIAKRNVGKNSVLNFSAFKKAKYLYCNWILAEPNLNSAAV